MQTIRSFQGVFFVLFFTIVNQSTGQYTQDNEHDLKMEFPDIAGYRTLKCDFHIHAVFSDGAVWFKNTLIGRPGIPYPAD